MFQLFVSDLDGTLLDNYRQITSASISGIKKLQEAGIEFIINTGRDTPNVLRLLEGTGIQCGLICSNGATAHTKDGTALFQHTIPMDIVKQVLDTFEIHNFSPVMFSLNGRMSLGTREDAVSYVKNVMIPSVQVSHPDFIYTDEMIDFLLEDNIFYKNAQALLNSDEKLLKIISHSLDPAALASLRTDIEKIPGLSVANTAPTDIEITSAKADKGKALLEYAKYRGYKLEEIIAVGDSGNDYAMLSLPGIYSVAMANATEAVKSVCDFETKSNTEDGVAALIEKIL